MDKKKFIYFLDKWSKSGPLVTNPSMAVALSFAIFVNILFSIFLWLDLGHRCIWTFFALPCSSTSMVALHISVFIHLYLKIIRFLDICMNQYESYYQGMWTTMVFKKFFNTLFFFQFVSSTKNKKWKKKYLKECLFFTNSYK